MKFKSSDNKIKIIFPGNCTISQAESIKAMILERINSFPEKTVVILSKVEDLDTAGVQIMLSLKKTLEYKGKKIKFAKPTKKVIEILDYYGLKKFILDLN